MTSHKSSMLKSLVWRAAGVAILAAVTYYFTRRWIVTTAITATHHALFLVVFYAHERVWLRIRKPTGVARNITKALVYEIILGMGFGGLIVLLYTGQWSKVTQITPTYTAIKLVLYFIYDRLWPEPKESK